MKRLVSSLLGGLVTLIVLIAYGCSAPVDTPTPLAATPGLATLPASTPLQWAGPTESPTAWVPPTALVGTAISGAEATLTAASPLQRGTLTITNSLGEKVV